MPNSSITKLPTATRSRWLKKISANANAPGGCKRQINGTYQPFGRARKDAMSRLAGILGIYPIESRVTGALAASVGGATPATIAAAGGTPATTVISTSELDPITWAGAGVKALTLTLPAGVSGEAEVAV